MVVAVATVVSVFIAVAGLLLSQRMDTKAGQVKVLDRQVKSYNTLISEIERAAIDFNSSDSNTILSDVILNKISNYRTNDREAIR